MTVIDASVFVDALVGVGTYGDLTALHQAAWGGPTWTPFDSCSTAAEPRHPRHAVERDATRLRRARRPD